MMDVPKTFSSLINPSLEVPFIPLYNLIDNLGNLAANTQFPTCNFGIIYNSDLRFNNQVKVLWQADVEVITYASISSPLFPICSSSEILLQCCGQTAHLNGSLSASLAASELEG